MVDASMTYPALWVAADKKAAEQQRLFYGATAGQLIALVLAAFAALIPSDALGGVGPVLTLLLFLAVVGMQVSGVATRAEQRWYDARAAAESIKSAAWQFAVGGESFRIGDTESATRFIELLQGVLTGLPHLDIGDDSTGSASATNRMAQIRQADLIERGEVYREGRVNDQVRWYTNKAAWNRQWGKAFVVAAVVVEGTAVTLGVLRVSGAVDTDLLSAFAACAAGLLGWSQAKKYTSLAEAYAVTSHEVDLVAASLDAAIDSEEAWAQSVHDAEAAFSREHTMWRARRQGPR
jgi:SMODS and SLOG-associating 2TM effector domain 3/SMODS and SLOG-associating 2TM effector domain 1